MMAFSFQQLTLMVKIAIGVVFYSAGWSIEFVIDRHGLWKYMPYYKVADLRIWDSAVGEARFWPVSGLSTNRSKRSSSSANEASSTYGQSASDEEQCGLCEGNRIVRYAAR